MVGLSAPVELLIDEELTDEHAHELSAVFAGFGMTPEVRRPLATRGLDDLTWLVLAALPLQGFLSGLGEEAIRDVYGAVKKLGGRIRKPKAQLTKVPMVLQDTETGLRIVLEDDLPAEAYQQLLELDLANYRLGPLHYDRHRKTWRSELDEAAG